MELPEPIATAVSPLLQHLPLDQAMPDLVPDGAASGDAARLLERILAAHPEVGERPALCAGLWLYVDGLDQSHALSQRMDDATGSFWHAMMHRREGDFGNSKYWYRRAGQHPAILRLPDYDSFEFVDEVSRRHRENPPELVARQRLEWAVLFQWCAEQAAEH